MASTPPTFRGIPLPPGRQNLKGIMATIRIMKRNDAEIRNAETPPDHRRSAARKAGYARHSEWPVNPTESPARDGSESRVRAAQRLAGLT